MSLAFDTQAVLPKGEAWTWDTGVGCQLPDASLEVSVRYQLTQAGLEAPSTLLPPSVPGRLYVMCRVLLQAPGYSEALRGGLLQELQHAS